MRRLIVPAAIAALSIAVAGGAIANAHEDHKEPEHPLVEARMGGMTMLVPTLAAVSRVAEGEGSVARAAFPASGMASFARSLPALFAPDTAAVAGSAAMPAVWSDAEGFAAQIAEFQAATAALQAAAQADDRDALNAALARTKAACQSCHDTYRAEPPR